MLEIKCATAHRENRTIIDTRILTTLLKEQYLSNFYNWYIGDEENFVHNNDYLYSELKYKNHH